MADGARRIPQALKLMFRFLVAVFSKTAFLANELPAPKPQDFIGEDKRRPFKGSWIRRRVLSFNPPTANL